MSARELLLSLTVVPLSLAALTGGAFALAPAMPRPQAQPPVLSLDVQNSGVLRVYGDDPSDLLGGGQSNAVAFGDVNGDGYADQIIGAALADTVGTTDFAGEVVVIWGGPTPSVYVDLDTDGNPGPTGDTRLIGEDAGDFLGASVASGDIDGDGLDDLVLGAIGGGEAGTGTGEVVIVYGDPALKGQALNVGDLPDNTRILGEDQQSSTGFSLATADIDMDGFDDVIIGAPGQFFFSLHPGGTVIVIYGGPSLRGATIDLNTDGVTTAFGETRIYGDRPGEELGFAVAAGDIDGDGYPDLVIGAPGADPFLSFDSGVVYVVYGGPSLRGATVDLNTNDAISVAGESRVLGVASSVRLGESVAAGDVNGDGLDDLVLGSPYAAPQGLPAGEVAIIPGHPGLRAMHVFLSAPVGTYNETRIASDEPWSRFGETLDVGDVDGDGLDDVAVGATGAVPLGQPESQTLEDGAVYVFAGLSLLESGVLFDPRASADLIITADDTDDRIGTSMVAGGDMNFDGVPELAFGTLSGNHPTQLPAENRAGWTATIFGTAKSLLAVRNERIAGGDAAAQDFGPVLRAEIDHASGSLSTDLVALARMSPEMPVAGSYLVVRVFWFVSTDRSQVDASLTLRYTGAEAAGGDEARFVVYTSLTGAGGTWKRAGTSQSRDLVRNAISVEGLTQFGFFCIAQEGLLNGMGGGPGHVGGVSTSRPKK